MTNRDAILAHVDTLTKAEIADLLYTFGRGSSRSYWVRNHSIADLRVTCKDAISERLDRGEGLTHAWTGPVPSVAAPAPAVIADMGDSPLAPPVLPPVTHVDDLPSEGPIVRADYAALEVSAMVRASEGTEAALQAAAQINPEAAEMTRRFLREREEDSVIDRTDKHILDHAARAIVRFGRQNPGLTETQITGALASVCQWAKDRPVPPREHEIHRHVRVCLALPGHDTPPQAALSKRWRKAARDAYNGLRSDMGRTKARMKIDANQRVGTAFTRNEIEEATTYVEPGERWRFLVNGPSFC